MASLTWEQAGGIFSIGSTISGLIGANAAANTEKYKLKSQSIWASYYVTVIVY